MHLLIAYIHLPHHDDPLLAEFTYGDSKERARKLKHDVKQGDYIFFHATISGRKSITAYYVVDRVLDTAVAASNKNITAKYRNPHILEFLSGERTTAEDDAVVFGDPITSRVLSRPLPFDKSLAKRLSLDIEFKDGKTETQIIGSATRNWRKLTDRDVDILLEAIESFEQEGLGTETILSTSEVTEIIERDIENFIEKNPGLLGESLSLVQRQFDTPVGRIDLLLEGATRYLVVEIKLRKIGRDAANQLRRYMEWLEKETQRQVSGAIVCEGVMPAFQEEFRKLKNIRIFCYGWQLKVYEWSGIG